MAPRQMMAIALMVAFVADCAHGQVSPTNMRLSISGEFVLGDRAIEKDQIIRQELLQHSLSRRCRRFGHILMTIIVPGTFVLVVRMCPSSDLRLRRLHAIEASQPSLASHSDKFGQACTLALVSCVRADTTSRRRRALGARACQKSR